MPYTVKGKCIFKKDGGAKVGCATGDVKKYLAALHANANESIEENEKPKIFTYTKYDLPSEEDLKDIDSKNLSAKEIFNGFSYTIVGRGINSNSNKDKIIKSIKMLIDFNPNNTEYKEALKMAENMGGGFIKEKNELNETKLLIKSLVRKKILSEIKYTIKEDDRKEYLNWKRKNVTLRGINDSTDENGYNGGGASFGSGLYTAFLSNKSLAKGYGKVYFVLNAIPKHPKIVDTWNNAEIFTQNVVNNWCKKNGLSYEPNEFYKKTNLRDEMISLGYDGLIIKGREMVNYTPPDNVVYFKSEAQLYNYFTTINLY